MMSPIYLPSALICSFCAIALVYGETEWVWSKNSVPHSSSSSNLNSNKGNGNNNFGGSSSIPQSPSRPAFQTDNNLNNGNNNNNALPSGTIRVVNGQGEARLIPGAVNFISNALQSSNGGNGGGGIGGGGGGGLISIGGGLLSSLLSNGPQIAGSAINFLLGRAPSNNGNQNKPTTLPANLPSFPVIGGSGNGGGGGSNFPSSVSSNSGSCNCINLNQCFLPNRPGGNCAGGNIMCCGTDSRTGALRLERDSPSIDINGNPTRNVKTPLDVRVALIENIVRGSSAVVDDAVDLVLQRYLTDEDKQKLATRVANYNG